MGSKLNAVACSVVDKQNVMTAGPLGIAASEAG